MKAWQLRCIVGATTAFTIAASYHIAGMRQPFAPPNVVAVAETGALSPNARIEAGFNALVPHQTVVEEQFGPPPPNAIVEAEFDAMPPSSLEPDDLRAAMAQRETSPAPAPASVAEDNTPLAPPERQEASLQDDHASQPAEPADSSVPELHHLSAFAYDAYAEYPTKEKPALVVLAALKDVPVGTPLQEIKHASDAFGLDFNFMKAVAKIESDFDPKQRTGSYIGLYQLSRSEFKEYGSGDILNPRDNAIAAADKFVTEAALFEMMTHRQPTISDLYLIHQQGWEGAAEHISHPERIAWKSMCATDEGMSKGERWCKRAIWGNTLPATKHDFKSVDRLTSGAFVAMWRDRVHALYARYAEAAVPPAEQAKQ